MSIRKLPQRVGMIMALLLMIGCSTPAATSVPPTITPVPPTTTPTPQPPTAAPTSTHTHLPPTTTPTPVPPTHTPSPVPPTGTPTQVYTVVTSGEEIAGIWVSGNYYIRFDADGTFRNARALDLLDSKPYAISSYQFDGTRLVTTEISVTGVFSCRKKIGRYEIRQLESGNIQLVATSDQCAGRKRDLEREYEPVP